MCTINENFQRKVFLIGPSQNSQFNSRGEERKIKWLGAMPLYCGGFIPHTYVHKKRQKTDFVARKLQIPIASPLLK